MEMFEKKFRKIIKRYRAELMLLTLSLICIIASFAFFITSSKKEEQDKIAFEEKKKEVEKEVETEKIYVDCSGAVEKPDVYKLPLGSRLKDVIVLAKGLSQDADRTFFARNYNLARILADGEKIYIPSKEEIEEGLVGDVKGLSISDSSTTDGRIDINSASESELDTLPGVGPATAKKIIDGRPYKSAEELVAKKAVNKGVYENIKDLISSQ